MGELVSPGWSRIVSVDSTITSTASILFTVGRQTEHDAPSVDHLAMAARFLPFLW